jgi:DNA-binding NarL/FixJ family response regulator
MSTAGLTLDPVRINRRRQRIADMTLAGWLEREIARELGVSHRTVQRDKAAMRREAIR